MRQFESLNNQIGPMVTTISQLEVQSSEELPSQTMLNLIENVSAIILRSGKEVEIPVKVTPTSSKQENQEDKVACTDFPNDNKVPNHKFPPFSSYKPVPPFPQALKGNIKDVHNGSLTMKFDGKSAKFNIYDSMKNPSNDNQVYSIDAIDYFVPKIFELDRKDELEVTISKQIDDDDYVLQDMI